MIGNILTTGVSVTSCCLQNTLQSSQLITTEKVDAFLTSDVSKPKIFLFSDKAKVPTILKALSSETVFKRSTKFAFVKKEEEALAKRFKVKKFPTFVMVRGQRAEIHEHYKGEMKFRDIQEWVNLYSESGMGEKVAGTGTQEEEMTLEESKPWLVQEVPELTRDSQADVCFKGEGLCVIFCAGGPIKPEETTMIKNLKAKFTSQLSGRGTTFKWMWIDMKIETNFYELFTPEHLPSAVVFNPHKRLRFTKLEGVVANANSIAGLIDKIQGGDARFTMVKGQKLPAWAERKKPGKGKGKADL